MNIKAPKTTLMLAVITLLFSCNTKAQEKKRERNHKPPTIEKLFEQMDKNEDGKLSKEEIKGPLKNDFKKIDTNKDGFLSKKEIEKAPKPKHPEGRPQRN